MQNVLSTAALFVFLAAGGISSWLLNNYIPNRSRRALLRDKLGQLDSEIDRLSLIDSSVRVAMGVQRNRLERQLGQGWAISADFTAAAAQIDTALTVLNRQQSIATKVDEELNKLDQLDPALVLPSRLLAVLNAIPPLIATLEKAAPSVAELDAIELKVADFQAMVRQINTIALSDVLPDLAKLDSALWNVNAVPAATWHSKFAPFSATLPELFTNIGIWRVNPPTARDLAQVVIELVRGALLLRFADFPGYSAADQPAFITYCNVGNADNLRAARKLVERLEAQALIDAIEDTGGAAEPLYITHSPTNIVSQVPVTFNMRFIDATLDRSPAKRNITCFWSFEHGGWTETGWRVQHYFPISTKEPEQHTIKVWFKTPDGADIAWHPPTPPARAGRREVWTSFSIAKPREDATTHENAFQLIRLAIVLGVALVGLLASARDQLQRLDLLPAAIAIFLLGFTAESIRNAFSSKTTA